MIAWGAQNFCARAFYAMHDTITPAVVGTAITVLNLPLYWLLVRHMQHLGLAAASSAGITAYTIILFVILIRKTSGSGMRGLMSFFARVSIASAIGGIVCWKFVGWLGERISWRTFHGAFIDLSLAAVVGGILTILVLHLFGVKEVKTYIKP